jgi:5'-methylthioadenosine phosphorylase
MTKIGIIGGSGLDNPDILGGAQDQIVSTRWGVPSSPLKLGKISGVDVALLGRHGREHTIPPTHVNYRANVQALKDCGCTHILATTAVGSLREDIQRGDLVMLDQFIDFTRRRSMSFHEMFAPHQPVHTPMADPFDANLREILIGLCVQHHLRFHRSGTVVTIEGPRFSTRAESRMFRAWGADVINMSIATEASLANEAGIPYAAVAMSTDYDCWKTDEEPVSWEAILSVFNSNAKNVTKLLCEAIPLVAKANS